MERPTNPAGRVPILRPRSTARPSEIPQHSGSVPVTPRLSVSAVCGKRPQLEAAASLTEISQDTGFLIVLSVFSMRYTPNQMPYGGNRI